MRYLTARDGVGFSFHITTLYRNKIIPLWYKNHVEAVYIIEGSLYLKHSAGSDYLEAGDLYLLDKNDRHELHLNEDTTVACVFNPAVNGDEDHDEDGAYRAPTNGMVSVDREYLKNLREQLETYQEQYGELAE